MRGPYQRSSIVFYAVIPLLIFSRPSDCIASYKFVLLVEGPRSDGTLPKAFACGLRAVEKLLQGQATLNEAVISLGDDWWSENEDGDGSYMEAQETEARDKLCQQLSESITAVLDLTTSGWPQARKLTSVRGVPFLRVEPTLSSFLRATEAVIIAKGASDAALIFPSEQDVDEAISLMVGRSHLRALVLNRLGQKTINKLRNMRPSPSYHVIFADVMNLERLFSEASAGGLVSLDDRWILTVTDFGKARVDTKGRIVLMLSPSKDSCCAFSAGGLCQDGTCGDEEDSEGDEVAMDQRAKGRMDVEEEDTCGPQLESMFVERMIQLLAEAAETSEGSSSEANPSPMSSGRNNSSRDECGSYMTPERPPKEFYSVVEQMASASSSIGLTEASSDPWTSNDTSFTLYPRLTIDVEVLTGERTSKVASWTSDGKNWGRSGLSMEPNSVLLPQRPFLRVGIVEMIPWAYWEEGEMGGEGRWTGYCVDFMEALAERMEVDYELVAYRGGDFGERRQDGSWDGAIGALSRGETDLLVASTVMTSEREEVIDFVAPYFEQTGISIVIRKPVKKTSLFKFMTVLRLEVWLSIVGALSITGVMIWFLDKYSPYSAQNNKKMYPYPCRKFTLKESFWFALTSFTPQGGGEAPKALSSRTLVAAYWLFVVLMLATFTANLAAFLTVERMQSPVQSLEQLARQSRINYTVVGNSTTHQYFINMRNAEDTLYRVWKEITLNSTSNLSRYRVWDYPIKEQYGHILLAIEQTGPVPSATEGFQKVIDSESGEFAFIHDASQVKYETSRNCNLTEVGEPFAEQPFAIAVQTGSHLQEIISRRILDLQKDRFFESLTGKYWNASSKGQCPNSEDTEGITLESLGGVFIATLFGLALAMVTLAGEVMYYRRQRARATKMAEMLSKGIPVETKKKGKILKKERFGFGRQRTRKVAAASLQAASIRDRGHRINRRNVEEMSHGQNFHLSRNLPLAPFQPVFREGADERQNRNTFMLNRDIW